MKFCPPMGPSSPCAKKPASGMSPRAPRTARASWSGWPNRREPRPLQLNSSPPRRAGLPSHVENDVFLRLGDDERLSQRPATLRHDGAVTKLPLQKNIHRARGHRLTSQQQDILARLTGAARHAAGNRQTRLFAVELFEVRID